MYIKSMVLTSDNAETTFLCGLERRCYSGVYPYKIFPIKGLQRIDFSFITILYGGNGSGKTTLLNILAQLTGVTRHSAFSGGAFFEQYVKSCKLTSNEIPPTSQILTSDDISDYLLNIRYLNNGIDTRRNELFEEYLDRKYNAHKLKSIADYDRWKESYEANKTTQSQFVKKRLMRNVTMLSNGETAMRYYVEHINENALYLIDEPEHSLSAALQKELAEYIYASAKCYGCQFVISTHSPFFLSIPKAKIYNLDLYPVDVCEWTQLENVREYYNFFMEHKKEFM